MPHECASCVPLLRAKEEICMAREIGEIIARGGRRWFIRVRSGTQIIEPYFGTPARSKYPEVYDLSSERNRDSQSMRIIYLPAGVGKRYMDTGRRPTDGLKKSFRKRSFSSAIALALLSSWSLIIGSFYSGCAQRGSRQDRAEKTGVTRPTRNLGAGGRRLPGARSEFHDC